MSIYKACDIRGIYGEDLDERIAFHIGAAIGSLLGDGDVLVGGDVRIHTPSLKCALIRGLRGRCDVVDIGTIPTPLLFFAQRTLEIWPCVMVTASHNPPAFNGVKLMLGRLPVRPEEIAELQRRAEREAPVPSVLQGYREMDLTDRYGAWLEQTFSGITSGGAGLEVVVDAGNGCYAEIAPRVLRNLGFKVTPLFCEMDGTFPNRDPNPSAAGHLSDLSRIVVESGADLGVAFDGDGDRVVFVDDHGQAVSSDQAIVLFVRDQLTAHSGGSVVYDLKCSSIVRREIEALGGIPFMERSGHAFIKRRMIEEGALFGGEISGHFFHKDLLGSDDGLYSALRMAGLLRRTGRSLSEVADEIPRLPATPDLRIPWESSDQPRVLRRIAAHFPPERVERLDGVRVQFERGWGLVRESITEPKLTLRFEGETPSDLHDVMAHFLEPVPELYTEVLKETKRYVRGI